MSFSMGSPPPKARGARARCTPLRRENVPVAPLAPAKFTEITRRGRLDVVLEGLAAAKAAGLAVKINAVALRGVNEEELDDLVAWTGAEGFDLVFIEVMPMGDIGGENRLDPNLPVSLVSRRPAPRVGGGEGTSERGRGSEKRSPARLRAMTSSLTAATTGPPSHGI